MPLPFLIAGGLLGLASAYLAGWLHGRVMERKCARDELRSPYLIEVTPEQAHNLLRACEAESRRFLSMQMNLTSGRWHQMALLFWPAWRAAREDALAETPQGDEYETRVVR